MASVKRVFVEKIAGYDINAAGMLHDLRDNLGIKNLEAVRIVARYDIQDISEADYAHVRDIVFAELPVDLVYDEMVPDLAGKKVFAIEYLPGQYDQRADSAAQCIQVITHGNRLTIATAQVLVCLGPLTDEDFTAIKNYCINPVDSREAALEKPESLSLDINTPPDVAVITGFCAMDRDSLENIRTSLGLAMRYEDIAFCQAYFRDTEKRDPTLTEIRMLDTYWSDHCRHTTFLSKITSVEIEPSMFTKPVERALSAYKDARAFVYGTAPKPMCLMDLATLGMKELQKKGLLDDLDSSDEINACSIIVNADIDGTTEEWVVMFKNETHNHPTEIEPFGGAATCLGGAIRDPLSGRSYVFHAMRVTGSGDPRRKVEETLPGKLPQRKITTMAAQGYSSYGNQIGLATGLVSEIYDEGYTAKRMEIGAVVGAAPRSNIRRSVPAAGDIIVLVGGRTGRDGCGGATGSSKEHTEHSIATCSAEVQKGNAPTERKIQRLFRDKAVSTMIKRCNDFGAGGVSVAIGELAEGLAIDLDAVPRKYEGLDGTELAISESQERMAIVLDPRDLDAFKLAVAAENLEMALVAKVTNSRRLTMRWRGKTIVDLSRDFIDTNGVSQEAGVIVTAPRGKDNFFHQTLPGMQGDNTSLKNAWIATMSDLNVCSQRGLAERFDSTIGAGSVLLPFGGKYQATPIESMVAKLPLVKGETTTGTIMSWGFIPRLSSWSPFHGAVYAVIHAAAKIVAAGGCHTTIRLTCQEYFEKLGTDPKRWGKPFSALLGLLYAEQGLGIPAIGGKDSMSGTFKDISVPPTLVAFALTTADVRSVISPEFKQCGHRVVLIPVSRTADEMPDFAAIDKSFSAVHSAIVNGSVVAAHTVGCGGIAEAIAKMSFGNRIGMECTDTITPSALFAPDLGSLVLELNDTADPCALFGAKNYRLLGTTNHEPSISAYGTVLSIEELYTSWLKPLDSVFAQEPPHHPLDFDAPRYPQRSTVKPRVKIASPRVLITVFPGTNCEYDTARAFLKAGAVPEIFVLRNLTADAIDHSIASMVKLLHNAQILMVPGGFSAGDEPDGSGKFIAAFFRNPHIKDAVTELLNKRDGLCLGICNGFQALIKLGLVPYGEIRDCTPDSPTLTFNTIGRHVSRMAYTTITSVQSPWFARVNTGDLHAIPVSHGEGRFVAPPPLIRSLFAQGQVATRYVGPNGASGTDMTANPNGSHCAIEGITSPDGRVLGKMGHSERKGDNVAKNIFGAKDQLLFESGVDYFS